MKKLILFSLSCIFIVHSYNVFGQRIKNTKDNNKVSTAIQAYTKPDNCSPTTAITIQKNTTFFQENLLKNTSIKNDKKIVSAFVKVSEVFDNNELQDLNLHINSKAGNIFIIEIPIDNLSSLAALENVEYIEIGHKVLPKLDNALSDTWVDWVHDGYNLSQPYTGDSVIVGIIDCGFDYTHPMFYDSLYSEYRISRVWEQEDITGPPPTGFSYGTELVGKSTILNNKCSDSFGNHGTHVAGIAAGSGSSLCSLYKGVAYNSEIILVSYKSESLATFHTNVADGISYIFNYADSKGKPAVINMSLGSHIGPHDGTSLFDEFCDNIVGKGKILVGAAGNEGYRALHLDYTFETQDTVFSFVEFPDSANNNNGYTFIDIWGEENKDFTIAVNIYNTNADEFADWTKYISTANDSTFNDNLKGICPILISVEHSNPQNNKPHIYVEFDKSAQDEPGDSCDYILLELIGKNTTIIAWCSQSGEAVFTDKNYSNVINGDSQCTIGEIGGTGKSVISVGAYNSKNSFTNYQDETYDFSFDVGDIAYYSSLGPTVDGRIKPDIAAPGSVVVSSVNSFDDEYNSANKYTVDNVNIGEHYWWFAIMEGTSIASPMVTGIIALWLEAKPELTPNEIKFYMPNNTWTDYYTGTVPNNTWGYGKINAHETLKALEKKSYDINASANPVLSGAVSGAGNYTYNDTVNLTAIPDTGYQFVNWTENGTEVATDSIYSFVVDSSRTIIANFELLSFDINASANPVSGGSVSGIGIYYYNDTVNLVAIPETGYQFINWTENGSIVSTDSIYNFNVTQSSSFTANFNQTNFSGLLPFGGCLVLDGTDDFAMAYDHPELDLGDETNEDFTLEAWINISSFSPSEIVNKPDAYKLYLDTQESQWSSGTGRMLGFSITSGDWSYTLSVSQFGGGSLNEPGWHHVAAVYNKSSKQRRLYIDGELALETEFDTVMTVNNSDDDLTVGNNFNGKIDEVRISDNARYQNESFTVANEPFKVDEFTRALWHFDEPEDEIECHDCSKYNNILFLQNDAFVTHSDDIKITETNVNEIKIYPNPFNNAATIEFKVAEACHLQIEILDISGRIAKKISDRWYNSGLHQEEWSGKDSNGNQVSDGIYLVKIHSKENVTIKKLIFQK